MALLAGTLLDNIACRFKLSLRVSGIIVLWSKLVRDPARTVFQCFVHEKNQPFDIYLLSKSVLAYFDRDSYTCTVGQIINIYIYTNIYIYIHLSFHTYIITYIYTYILNVYCITHPVSVISPNICGKTDLLLFQPMNWPKRTRSTGSAQVTLRIEIFPSLRPLCFFFLGEDCGAVGMWYVIGNAVCYWKYPVGTILLKLICILSVPFCAYLKWFPVVPVPVNPWTNLLVQLGSYRSSLPTWSVGLLGTSGKTLESLPQQSLMEKILDVA